MFPPHYSKIWLEHYVRECVSFSDVACEASYIYLPLVEDADNLSPGLVFVYSVSHCVNYFTLWNQ